VKNISTTLIEVLLRTIDKVGIKKTIKVLEISYQNTDDRKIFQGLILLTTCSVFGISEKTLLTGRKNIADRTNAIGVSAFLLKKMCKYSQREISYILRKEATNINKYIKRFENLDVNFKSDNDLLIKMRLIEEECMRHYEINKTK
jgi:hypothetical protein